MVESFEIGREDTDVSEVVALNGEGTKAESDESATSPVWFVLTFLAKTGLVATAVLGGIHLYDYHQHQL